MEIRRKDIMRILMIILYLIFTVSGLILMKKGGNAGKITLTAGEFGFTISWISALGFICYIISGFTGNGYIGLIVGLIATPALLFAIYKKQKASA